MSSTLEDESGFEPEYEITWEVKTNKNDNGDDPYNVKTSKLITISSTKTPYIPSNLYNNIGEQKFIKDNIDYYRCCTPIDIKQNTKYDGFVNYSMCQATGYKLKSNKELPSPYQVFSKLIPLTTYPKGSPKPSGNQLYPMYSILEFEHKEGNICAINVKMCRVTGIFTEDNGDTFTQTSYGNRELNIHYLVEVNSSNVNVISGALGLVSNISNSDYMYGAWIPEGTIYTIPDSDLEPDNNQIVDVVNNNKYLYIEY
jgi:hypothetical protein